MTFYRLSIVPKNVPVVLMGAPLPLEILPKSGLGRRAFVMLPRGTTFEDVDEPGPYLIRATLPSGQLIAQVATIPNQLDAQGIASGDAVLDLSGYHAGPAPAPLAAKELWITKTLSVLPFGLGIIGYLYGRLLISRRAAFEGKRLKSWLTIPAEYIWGVFSGWEQASECSENASNPKLVFRRGGVGDIDPLGHIIPVRHIMPATRDQRPLLIKMSLWLSGEEALIAWLPGASQRPAILWPNTGNGGAPGAPTLKVYYESGQPIIDVVSSYVSKGAIQDARAAAPPLINYVQRKLRTMLEDPNQLMLAAYVLYKLSIPEAESVIDLLSEHYRMLPDAQILKGSILISQGKANEAVDQFNLAMTGGVPVYTEGVRLLRDGLNFLKGLYPKDIRIRTNASLANCIAAAANFESELTCLRLGNEIVIKPSNDIHRETAVPTKNDGSEQVGRTTHMVQTELKDTKSGIRKTNKIGRMLVGESLVGDGNEVAHIDLIMGPRGSAAELAFANALVNNKDGFTTLLAVVAPNLLCKPNTILFNKVTIKGAKQAVQMFGPAQHGVAKAVADSVAEGVIPVDEADDIFISVGVFIHWDANDDKKIQDFNYQATKEAIARAVKGEPKASEVVARRNAFSHPFAPA